MSQVTGVGILVYGHSLDSAGNITQSTKRRVRKAVAVHGAEDYLHSCVVSAAGYSPDVPNQTVAMNRQMSDYALSEGAYCVVELPAATFDTCGEQEVFVAQGYWREVHVTSWWHMPRVIIGRRRLGYCAGVHLVQYVPVWDIPAPRSFFLECGKLSSLLLPASIRMRLAQMVKSRMRTSW